MKQKYFTIIFYSIGLLLYSIDLFTIYSVNLFFNKYYT